ncbi:MAG: nucleoside monophosphate kinase [Candidatus Ureaplasma intestinipullorum]|uniref:Adenylate kinase n=1 Tax=Candidatus Ureaplasma intestinipullorum TaxID=2838770 RepID=A0A9E2NVY8_9BACT|nr:nucleoside monophosphate kinase [Candidatus Ureaplasma intestinipullorum]
MNIILIGAPGCGKGSLSKKLLSNFNLAHISTGDLFRDAIKKDDDFANEIKSIIASGQYVPDSITNKIASDAILESLKNHSGFILDGYPRTIDQANFLNGIANIDYVIYLKIDPSILIDRIISRRICPNCGAIFNIKYNPKPIKENVCDYCDSLLMQRKDDNINVAKDRIDIYFEQTQPLIDYYVEKGKLIEVDASKTIDEVYNEVLNIIKI